MSIDNCQSRHELEPEEYNETKAETLESMREFQSSLSKLAAGDLSLTDYFTSIQLVYIIRDNVSQLCIFFIISGLIYYCK